MPRKRAGDAILACAALALLVLFAVLRAMQPQAQYSQPSTYDTGGNGYAALYDFLARERVAVRRFEAPFGEFHQRGGALVLAGDGAVAVAAPSADALDTLDKWVRAGGTLLVLGSTTPEERRALELPKTLSDHKSILSVADKTAIHIYRRARGSIVIADSAAPFSNRELPQRNNAALAYQLFGSVAPVAFDERIYGYETGHTFWQVLPWGMRIAIVLACIAVLLAIAGANLPFAPPAALEPPAERDSGAYIASLARMLQRGGAAREIIARLERQAESALASRARGDERAHTLLEQFQTLTTYSHPGLRELLAAGRLFALVRKEYEW
jgi:hypothetical protein